MPGLGFRSKELLAVILIVSAVAPAAWLLVKVYKADRLEKEPAGLLVSLLLFGMLATAPAGLTEQFGASILKKIFPGGGFLYDLLLYLIVVAVSEEGFKYLLLHLRTWNSSSFNCSFDGVVYSVFVSLGFALWENIAYVLSYGLGTAVARAVTAVPGHACFGVFMGVWYGVAKRYDLVDMRDDSVRARRSGLITAVLLHGIYDFIASMENNYMGIVFLLFIGWMFKRALFLVKQASIEDSFLERQRFDHVHIDI